MQQQPTYLDFFNCMGNCELTPKDLSDWIFDGTKKKIDEKKIERFIQRESKKKKLPKDVSTANGIQWFYCDIQVLIEFVNKLSLNDIVIAMGAHDDFSHNTTIAGIKYFLSDFPKTKGNVSKSEKKNSLSFFKWLYNLHQTQETTTPQETTIQKETTVQKETTIQKETTTQKEIATPPKQDSFENIKTITVNENGEFVYSYAFSKSQTMFEDTIKNIQKFEEFEKSKLYKNVTSLMKNRNHGLKFDVKYDGKTAIYCALVLSEIFGEKRIFAYVGKTTTSVSDRWDGHISKIKTSQTKQYKCFEAAGADNILVFYLTNELSEHECATLIFERNDYKYDFCCLNKKNCDGPSKSGKEDQGKTVTEQDETIINPPKVGNWEK